MDKFKMRKLNTKYIYVAKFVLILMENTLK